MSDLLALIKAAQKPVVGMVQLAALPGSSRYTGGRHRDDPRPGNRGSGDSRRQRHRRADGAESRRPAGRGACDRGAGRLDDARHRRDALALRPSRSGLNLLENDAEAMFAVASAADADFVRIKVYVGAMMTPFGLETAQAFAAIKARNACDAGARRDLRRRA